MYVAVLSARRGAPKEADKLSCSSGVVHSVESPLACLLPLLPVAAEVSNSGFDWFHPRGGRA